MNHVDTQPTIAPEVEPISQTGGQQQDVPANAVQTVPRPSSDHSPSLNDFIEAPIIRPDGAIQPIQLKTVGHLLSYGTDPENIQAAMLVSTIMISASLGYPVSGMLSAQDSQTAIQLIDNCMNLIPSNALIQFQEVKPEHIFNDNGKPLDRKCIISTAIGGFGKVHSELKEILTRGYAVRQELEKGKFKFGLSEYRAQMQVAILGIDDGRSAKQLAMPGIIPIPISPKGVVGPQDPKVLVAQYDLRQSPAFKIRMSFERLKHRRVIIPYEGQLVEALKKSYPDFSTEKVEVLKKVISVCAIINQPPSFRMAELMALVYRTDEKEAAGYLTDAGQAADYDTPPEEPIVATKVDYYLARLMLDGLLVAGNMRFGERLKKVFETVKEINIAKSRETLYKDEVELQASFSINSSCWATREKVFERINTAGVTYSMSSVNEDLANLLKLKVLERDKPTKSRHFGYYVLTMNLEDTLALPAAETIKDPVYNEKPVFVVNPITGQVEKI